MRASESSTLPDFSSSADCLRSAARLVDAPFAQIDLAHGGAQARRARVDLAGERLVGGGGEQRLRGLERAPGRVGIARVFLAGHRVERERERLARRPARSAWRAHRVDQHGRRRLGHAELLERDADGERHLGHRGIEAVALARDGERRRAEEIAVVDEVFVVVRVVLRLAARRAAGAA